MKLQYVVTGTGRCGTVYMARLLTSVGVPCGHESVFTPQGIVLAEKKLRGDDRIVLSHCSQHKMLSDKSFQKLENWVDPETIVADSSYMSAPYLRSELLIGCKIIHIVRDPMQVVQSFTRSHICYFLDPRSSNPYEMFIRKHLPELIENMTQADRACLYWLRWNQMIEKQKPDLFYRVEDDPKKVLGFLGKADVKHFANDRFNSWKPGEKGKFSLDMVKSKSLREEFVEKAREYGYAPM